MLLKVSILLDFSNLLKIECIFSVYLVWTLSFIISYVCVVFFKLCRSSAHGKGLNRFWSNVEGYHGPVLILISAISEDSHQDCSKTKKWIIGALTQHGFENKDTFYGSSGNLYAISPIFHSFSPSGMQSN